MKSRSETKEFNRKVNFSDIIQTKTPIQEFYNGETIFITGGTGFLGRVLIGILLKRCSDVSRIYVLARDKKGKKFDERIRNFLIKSPFCQGPNDDTSQYEKKIFGIPGDCSEINLGLSESHSETLKNEVSIVFHLAATIRFDEKLKCATNTNIRGTSYVIDLCKNMPKLKALMHISTTYSNCFTNIVEEKIYDYPLKYEQLKDIVNAMPDKLLDSLTPEIIKPWPNTYTFTKALTEDLIRERCMDLPVGIFRPGIVTPSVSEPVPGWTDSFTGATGQVAGLLKGTLRTLHCNPEMLLNLVPVDLTVNAILAATWSIAQRNDKMNCDVPIFNFTSTEEAPISTGQFMKFLEKYVAKYPSNMAIWYPSLGCTKSIVLNRFYTCFLHRIPALLLDSAASIAGKKPRFNELHQKMEKLIKLLNFFVTNDWRFKNKNTRQLWTDLHSRDQQLFPFTMKNFNWHQYIENYVKGVRIFLFKDDLNTLESGRKKWRRFYWIHHILVVILQSSSLWILYKLFLLISRRYRIM